MISTHEIAAKYPLPRHSNSYIRFFLTCLKQLSEQFPVDARDALVLAERHWRAPGEDTGALSDARTRILNRVSETGRSGSLAETPYRLVSFVLDSPTGCAVDYLEWFELYMEQIGAAPAIFKSALAEVFGQVSD